VRLDSLLEDSGEMRPKKFPKEHSMGLLADTGPTGGRQCSADDTSTRDKPKGAIGQTSSEPLDSGVRISSEKCVSQRRVTVNGDRRRMRLSPGMYLGQVLGSRRVGDFVLSETVYEPGARIPKHSHEDGYFCLVRGGTYTEAYGRRKRNCGPLTLAFHPPDEMHSEKFGEREVRSFNIGIAQAWFGQMKEYSVDLDGSAEFHGGPGPTLAMRLYKEFRRPDSA